MQHLIVVAHPLADSLTMKLAHALTDEVERLGHTPRVHNLYRMDFNPVLAAHELEPLSHSRAVDADVAQAQADVRDADVLTVIYPLWWATMPAILKGYIDRVFARGFAYDARGGHNRPLLPGRDCLLITLSGSPLSMLRQNGQWSAVQTLQDAHIFESCGFRLLEHVHFDEVEPPITEDILRRDLQRIRHCAQRHFGSRRGAESHASGNRSAPSIGT